MRRSQVALEFLVTYGWAILGVTIVLTAILYFGILDTGKYVNDACNFGTQFACEDWRLTTDGILQVTLRNNFGVPIDITEAYASSDYGQDVNCNTMAYFAVNAVNSSSCSIISGSETIPENEKVKIKVLIGYQGPSGNPHNLRADIIATAQSP